MKLINLAQRKAQHVICFGDPKSGKSQLVAQLAAKYKLLWFSLDNGHEILFKLPKPWQENIDIVCLPDTKDYAIAIETALKVITGAKVSICNAHGKVSCQLCIKEAGVDVAKIAAVFTEVWLNNLEVGKVADVERTEPETIVVWDHISQLADSAMNHITKSQKDGDLYKPTWEDYRVQGNLMSKFLTNVEQSNYHCICLAHCTETEMEDGKKKIVPLVGSTPFSRNAGKYFDHMVHFDVRNGRHSFGSATTYIPNIVTGSRSDIAIERMMGADGKTLLPSLIPFFDGSVPRQEIAATAGQVAVASLAAEVKK